MKQEIFDSNLFNCFVHNNKCKNIDPDNIINLNSKLRDQLMCSVCMCIMDIPSKMHCGHIFCAKCIMMTQERVENKACPICRQKIVLNKITINRDLQLKIYDLQFSCETCQRTHYCNEMLNPNTNTNVMCILCGLVVKLEEFIYHLENTCIPNDSIITDNYYWNQCINEILKCNITNNSEKKIDQNILIDNMAVICETDDNHDSDSDSDSDYDLDFNCDSDCDLDSDLEYLHCDYNVSDGHCDSGSGSGSDSDLDSDSDYNSD